MAAQRADGFVGRGHRVGAALTRQLVSLAVLLVLTACKQGSPTEPRFEANATLSGTVTRIEGGAPVAAARVTAHMLVVKGTDSSVEAFTDQSGHYSLSTIGGTYVVSVFAPGATTPSYVQTIVIGLTPMADFQISIPGCVTMSGRVVDANTHAGISGATIDFVGKHVVTAAEGSFLIYVGCPVRVSSAMITIDHPNYLRREYLTSVPTYSTTTEIVLQPR